MVRVAASLLLGVVVAATAGCGGSRRAVAEGQLRRGRTVFASSCAGCHTLAGREVGAVGGDLALAGLRAADLASFAKVMPTRAPLSEADASAVAAYVAAEEARMSRETRKIHVGAADGSHHRRRA